MANVKVKKSNKIGVVFLLGKICRCNSIDAAKLLMQFISYF